MRKPYGKYGILAVLVLALLLGLLLAAGPAAAATSVSVTQSVVMGVLDEGIAWQDPEDGTLYTDDFVIYSLTYKATGPDGWRCLGYIVICIDVVEPLKGDNSHSGVVAVLGLDDDPGPWWDADQSFSENLAGHDLLWTGTWDGYTLNKRLHKATLLLEGWPESVNDDCSAVGEIKSGNFDVANWHSDRYVGTPWNALLMITTP